MLSNTAPQTVREAWQACERAGHDAANASRREASRHPARHKAADRKEGERAKRAALYRAGFVDDLGYPTVLAGLVRSDPGAAFTVDPVERDLVAELELPLNQISRLTAGLVNLPTKTRADRSFRERAEGEIAELIAEIQARAGEAGIDPNRLLALAETARKLDALTRQPLRRAA